MNPPSDEFASVSEILKFEEPSPDKIESNIEVELSQPHIYYLSDGEELDELGEEELESEESFQKVEVLRQGWTGVEYALSRSLETSLPRLPSTPSFEWVKLISISFTVPLEYGILETDGQLRRLCGIKRKRRMFSGWSCKSRLIKVEISRARCKG